MIKKVICVFGLLYSLTVLADQHTVILQPSDDRHMSNLTQLTFKGDNGEAYFSFNGQQLIYQSNRDGYQCDKIWTMDIDGSYKKMVSPNQGVHNAWPLYSNDIYLINSDGTGLERFIDNKVFNSFPMFSPDGKKIAFGSNRNAQKPRATDTFIADWSE